MLPPQTLDLIGDSGAVGQAGSWATCIAERAGHAMHAALVARIMSDASLYEIVPFDQLASGAA